MTATKNNALIRAVRKHLAGGVEQKVSLPTPGTRFEKLGTIFSRTTGLIKSGVMPEADIPIWFSVYKAFPPKYEPKFNRPPIDVEVKHIYYPEDKLRARLQLETINLGGSTPPGVQWAITTFLERRKTCNDEEELLHDLMQRHHALTSSTYDIPNT